MDVEAADTEPLDDGGYKQLRLTWLKSPMCHSFCITHPLENMIKAKAIIPEST